MRTLSDKDYLKAAQIFDGWATLLDFIIWFLGIVKRHSRSEEMLPRLVKKGLFRVEKYGSFFVYSVKRVNRTEADASPDKIAHDLGKTRGLVLFWRSVMSAEIIPERLFKGLGSIPEWGMKLLNGTLLLYEFCTKDNFYQRLKPKLGKYETNLTNIEDRFGGRGVVVFVCDVPRERVVAFIERNRPTPEFAYFTDYQTFKNVPIGEALTAPIYLWQDGQSYPLKSAK